ncbi:hypothetical protein BOSEA31B_20521 [Hyphomicrobiales bacterium]|nr:hypothetical protein BOSEA31B_20521 [Hyphomicrobiales bacterium]CAH1702988.1 hypothetical protein BOSEA1005_30860 [Hyphomicrobiales bacterium]
MIAGRVRCNTLLRLLVVQAKHRVRRAARFEGPSLLKVLALEEEFGASKSIDECRCENGCAMNMGFD